MKIDTAIPPLDAAVFLKKGIVNTPSAIHFLKGKRRL